MRTGGLIYRHMHSRTSRTGSTKVREQEKNDAMPWGCIPVNQPRPGIQGGVDAHCRVMSLQQQNMHEREHIASTRPSRGAGAEEQASPPVLPCVRPGPFLAGTTAHGIHVVPVAIPKRRLAVLCSSRPGEGQSDEEEGAEPREGLVWYLSCPPRGRRADIQICLGMA